MSELWFQQNFLSDRISIRLGQLGADSEFGVPTYDTVFLNGTFGWSPISIRTSQMEALRILWARRACEWRLRL